MFPIGSSSLLLLNQSTHSSVAYSTASSERHGEHDVVVLFAAESGSRAWGFASPDSDYDVRFIYAHNRDWYTGLYDRLDVIERPLDAALVDLAGWDVKKALRLLLKSNPALYEWIVSPVVYADDGAFRPTAQALFERVAERSALAHHYHSVAAGQWRREIDGNDLVKLKKYFYVVRPLLSLQWVLEHGSLPPMNLQQLMAATDVPHHVRAAVLDLLELKRTTPELGSAFWINGRSIAWPPSSHRLICLTPSPTLVLMTRTGCSAQRWA